MCIYLIGRWGYGSLRRVPDEPAAGDAAGLRAANAWLWALLAKGRGDRGAVPVGLSPRPAPPTDT